MRTYLVVIDDSPEASLALRFAGAPCGADGRRRDRAGDHPAAGFRRVRRGAGDDRGRGARACRGTGCGRFRRGGAGRRHAAEHDQGGQARRGGSRGDRCERRDRGAGARDGGVGRTGAAGRAFHRTGCGHASLSGDAGAGRDRYRPARCAGVRRPRTPRRTRVFPFEDRKAEHGKACATTTAMPMPVICAAKVATTSEARRRPSQDCRGRSA